MLLIGLLFTKLDTIKICKTIGIYRASNITMPVEMFQNTVLSPNPSKPEPLFAEDDVNSYNTCDTPWNCGLVNASDAPGTIKASAEKPKLVRMY